MSEQPFDWTDFVNEEADEIERQEQRRKDQEQDASGTAAPPVWQPTVIDVGEDLDPIPPRAWLLGNSFCREFVSSVFAAGATGKTALRVVQLLALATGQPLTGERVFQRSRVMMIGLEDGIDELRRRVRAAMRHYGVKHEDIKGWFYIVKLPASGSKLILDTGETTPLSAWIREQIVDKQLDIVCFDPLIKLHNLPENDNDAMEQVIETLVDISVTHKIAVDAPHHMRKGAAEPGDADAGRGASAFKDGGRLVYTLTPMSDKEAKQFGIAEDQRRRYVRLDHGKVNLVRPTKARWFELIGVKLDNGTDLYPNGDEIQVAIIWTPPETWEDVTDAITNAILNDIEKGLPDGRLYSRAGNAKETGAWRVVQEHLPDKSQAQCREMINTWFKNETLYDEEYTNPKTRENAKGLRVNAENWPMGFA
jgi:hypothetical protein